MKITTAYIKSLIPNWWTSQELEQFRNKFIPAIPLVDFKKEVLNTKNWKRETKQKEYDSNNIERTFDCRSFEGQLRLYVCTDSIDSNILNHYFQTE